MLPSNPPFLVVCAVISDGVGRILAAQRGPGKSLAGKWEFPGGKIEPEESPESALQRELREEMGIDVNIGAALTPVTFSYPTFAIRLIPFRCRIAAGDPVPHEHTEIRWVAVEDLAALDWADADVPIVQEIASGAGNA